MSRISSPLLALALLLGCGGPQATESSPPEREGQPTAATSEAGEDSDPAPSTTEAADVSAGEAPIDASASAAQVRAALERANQFGFELYQHVRAGSGNVAVSPASVHLALAMTYGGARGDTATEMARVLHVGASDDGLHQAYGAALRTWNATAPATLRVANRIFVHGSVPLEPAFVTLTRDRYGAPIEPVDFAGAPEPTRLGINRWVEGRTEQRIPELLPAGSITPLTRLVLANAIYFKGTWQTQFDPALTRPRSFLVAAGTEASVATMHLRARFAWANHPDGVRVLETPYAGGELSMLWLLPSERTGPDALAAIEAALSQETLARWRSALREVDVEVQIPRFRLEPPTRALSEPLEALGMRRAFAADADFRGIATLAGGLYVSEVFHKAFVEVNEEGTEAAAATAVVMATRSARPGPRPEPPRFIADHPFLFLLLDRRTGAVLFLGRVSDPR